MLEAHHRVGNVIVVFAEDLPNEEEEVAGVIGADGMSRELAAVCQMEALQMQYLRHLLKLSSSRKCNENKKNPGRARGV